MTDEQAAHTTAASHPAHPVSGLSFDEVRQRIEAGKVNVNTELKSKSVRQLVVENTCTLFNLINLVLAILVISTGSFKNLSFLFIVILNTGIGIAQSLRSKRMVDKLTLLTSKRAVVVREGQEREVDLDQIVLDDVVRLGRGDQVPADAEVVSGEAYANESLLTGESDLIRKQPGCSLMSGSFIDSGLVLARVIHVGRDNYVAQINNEAKYVKKVNSEIMDALASIVRFASIVMVPLGLALFYSSISEAHRAAGVSEGIVLWVLSGQAAWDAVRSSILTCVGALLGMIPQGLVLLTSSVLAIATVRLARRGVLAQQLYCIEALARVDVLCLDKTGTITSGRMEVAGLYPVTQDGQVLPQDQASLSERASLDMALAGIARGCAADANETAKALLDYYAETDVSPGEPLNIIPFSSVKKWSGAVLPHGSYVMGAAPFVLDDAALQALNPSLAELAQTARVLVVASVDGFSDQGDMVGRARCIGLVAIRDEIRRSAAETISYFREQGVDLRVISGDDPRTVSSIAQVVGIPQAEVFVDATTLDSPAKIEAAADRYRVFGRVTPQQKRELVQALQRAGHTVAMTGDGVNDVLALKEADCSVAMAAGSEAARNVAEIVLVNNDFASMPAVVAEGRRSINNLQRSAALFLTKTLFSMGLAALCIAVPPYPFQPVTMTLINFFCIGLPSFVLALEPNHARVQGRFLTNVLRRAIPASLAVIVGAGLCMAASQRLLLSTATLSSMCLITTCAVGCSLIWRISQPFTLLRLSLFIFAVAGILIGFFGFPEFFSVDSLTIRNLILAGVLAIVASALFFGCAYLFERGFARTRKRRSATGFGRGVRVSRRAGKRSVSSTGSSVRRMCHGVQKKLSTLQVQHQERQAIAHAAQELSQASGNRKIKRHVEKSAAGIRVTMKRTHQHDTKR